MSETNKIKFTPGETLSAKNAAIANKTLAIADKLMLAANIAATEALRVLEEKQLIATQKEEAAQNASAAYDIALTVKSATEQKMFAAKAAGDQARADAEAARIAKLSAARETAIAKKTAIEEAKIRAAKRKKYQVASS